MREDDIDRRSPRPRGITRATRKAFPSAIQAARAADTRFRSCQRQCFRSRSRRTYRGRFCSVVKVRSAGDPAERRRENRVPWFHRDPVSARVHGRTGHQAMVVRFVEIATIRSAAWTPGEGCDGTVLKDRSICSGSENYEPLENRKVLGAARRNLENHHWKVGANSLLSS